MTILLVDDEADILEGIVSGVDFAAIGIGTVLTAGSAAEAREIIASQPVDILLTDIEMPGESGLELLAWLRSEGYEPVTLFCTGFASFDYAKKAMELHSFDYYLKPIAYTELQERLAAAVARVNKEKSAQNYKKLGEYWLNSQKDNTRRFWLDLFFTTNSIREVVRAGHDNGLEYSPSATFTLCAMIALDRTAQVIPRWKVYGFRNIAEETFEAEALVPEAMIPAYESSWLLVLVETGALDAGALEAVLGGLIEQQSRLFDVVLDCYYLRGCHIETIRQDYSRLKAVFSDDVSCCGAVYDAARYKAHELVYDPAKMPDWPALIAAENLEDLCRAAENKLDALCEAGEINRSFLKAMRVHILQAVFAELDRRGINGHTLFLDEEYERMFTVSLKAVFKFREYLRYLFSRALEHMAFAAESQTVIGQVKKYIKEHLSEEINRATVAQRVFLNPDYLARLFKKETGETLGSYLQQQRIREAKRLLAQGGVPVNEIAQRVGYDNYSYFSYVFKAKTGMSPNEYRKCGQ